MKYTVDLLDDFSIETAFPQSGVGGPRDAGHAADPVQQQYGFAAGEPRLPHDTQGGLLGREELPHASEPVSHHRTRGL